MVHVAKILSVNGNNDDEEASYDDDDGLIFVGAMREMMKMWSVAMRGFPY